MRYFHYFNEIDTKNEGKKKSLSNGLNFDIISNLIKTKKSSYYKN